MSRLLHTRNRTTYAAVMGLAVLVALALFAHRIAPYGVDVIDLARRRGAPSQSHWFGTDELGRDVFTRILFGARVSLSIGLVSAALSAFIGITVGALGGYRGGWVDALLMRMTDAILSVPRLPLLMTCAVVLNPSIPFLILLVGAVGWMEMARVVRAEVQSLAARDFVAAARALGATSPRVIMRHVLPGVLPTATVAMTLAVGRGVLMESALSFFGVGVQPPAASWGNMLYQAQTTMGSEPWLGIFPGAFIFGTVLCCNVLGDTIAQARQTERGS